MVKRKKRKMVKVVTKEFIITSGKIISRKCAWNVTPVPKSLLAKASKPIEAPEPDFSEIKHLLSNKPLQFNPHRRR